VFSAIATHELIDLELAEVHRTNWHRSGHITAAARERAHLRELKSIQRAARKKP
jgi:hypothetical protein